MNKRQVFASLIGSVIAFSIVSPVFAESAEDRIELRQEAREASREESREAKDAREASKAGLLGKIFNNRKNAIRIVNGKITAKSGSTLTILKDSTTYTVNTDAQTQFSRKFWGKSSLDEMSAGNMVNVIGRWTDDAHTAVLARQVRNLSIQKRFGVFFGTIKSLSSNGWVMSTVGEKRPDQTVTTVAATKFVNRKEEAITSGDIKVGQRVRVKGLWDSSENTVTEVTHIKDFDLPVKPTVTSTP